MNVGRGVQTDYGVMVGVVVTFAKSAHEGLRFADRSWVARAANNEVFVYVLKQLRETLSLQSRFANSVGDRRASSNAEHDRIVAAIEARDAAAAASAMTEHLDHVQSALASLSPAGDSDPVGYSRRLLSMGEAERRGSGVAALAEDAVVTTDHPEQALGMSRTLC